MRPGRRFTPVLGIVVVLAALGAACAQEVRRLILPEQRHVEIRDPSQFSRARLPDLPPPATVSDPQPDRAVWPLSLDETIRIALANTKVVRVVAGTTAVASGATIYDPAITNTEIDQNRARFDPAVQSQNQFFRSRQPQGVIVAPGPPPVVEIQAPPVEGFHSSTGVSKTFITGGNLGVNVNVDQSRSDAAGLPLNPQTANNVAINLDQPLLKGAGSRANLAPILIARINTERSFFQMKDSVQDLVLSVIQTYWNLSFAYIDVWTRQQQVKQGQEALEYAEGRLAAGFGHEGDVAQARVSYENFRATLVGSEANLLTQEAVLRNLLGLPPSDLRRIELSTGPMTTRLPADWQRVFHLAQQYRPDVIELKLVLEADQQQLLLSRNQSLPQLDAVGLYRWNGLEGTTPSGERMAAGGFADWQLGVNFSVPLGLRKERALMRESELLIMRDSANLEQSLHSAAHLLAGSFRNLAQYYQQYELYRLMREAASVNVERQLAELESGRTRYLFVLQAITDWGNAVSSESQALIQYNTELARLERLTGTILETHGVRFVEERCGSIGPLGRLFGDRCYPRDMRPGPNADLPRPPESETYKRPEPVEVPPVDADVPRSEEIPAPAGAMPGARPGSPGRSSLPMRGGS